MSEPLSDEELNAIRQRATSDPVPIYDGIAEYDRRTLLAELDRLRAENALWRVDAIEMREKLLEEEAQVAAMRSIVEQFVAILDSGAGVSPMFQELGLLSAKARALLAKDGEASSTTDR